MCFTTCLCFYSTTGETFVLKNIHNDMKIAEMMGYAEFVTGVPKFMQRIRYLDECKCVDLRVVSHTHVVSKLL